MNLQFNTFMKNKTAIKIAADYFGTDVKFATVMRVTPQAIGKWKRSKAPSKRCIDIEKKTNGTVTRYELRPDIFGNSPDNLDCSESQ